jgi:hypothetical protein
LGAATAVAALFFAPFEIARTVGTFGGMIFTRRLREPVMRGEITCSVRIWQRPHVKVRGRYALGPGAIEVTSIREIVLEDITPELARRSGFDSVADLMETAKHGPGETIYLVTFEYHE